MSDRIRVLYVDDNCRATQIHAEMLSNYGFEVVTALTPDAGLDRLSGGEVDCVLSDLTMPETNGFEFLAAIRDDHPRLPFILFTGEESADTVSTAFERGVTDFVPKSFCTISYELLTHRIEQAILTTGFGR